MTLVQPLDVPWFAQHFVEPDSWPGTHGLPHEGPEHWGHNSCGLACLRALCAFHGLPVPEQHQLLIDGLAADAYSPSGWVHQGLVDLARAHGLAGEARGFDDTAELVRLAEQGFPSIVSCTFRFPQDGRRGGHLVLFAGEFGTPTRMAGFMDPSSWGRHQRVVPAERFWASWTGRAIVLQPEELHANPFH